ncbi:MAG: cation:proton antiporter [Labilithrix sp.]|nr:cation:proton antiporter [Labilithrix sp.]
MLSGWFHGPVGILIAQLVIILALSRGLGFVAARLRQPLVIAEIVAGIVLGPSLLGWLAPSVLAAVFPAESLQSLKMLSQVGLLLFMFLVGLELDPKLLRGRGRASVAISHTSIVVPFALGALAAPFLYARLSSPSIPFVSFLLFIGISMSVTAFPVLARILTERRLLTTEVGAISITCAAVDDVTAWCLLAFVVSVVRASNVGGAVLTTFLALAYAAGMLVLVRPFVARMAARVATRDGLTQGIVAFTLVLLLLSSLATEMIGIHALFGAFIFGAIIPKDGALARLLAEKLEDVAVVLLLPIFFAYSGLRTEIGLLSTPGSWGICGLIILLACAGKFGGSTIAARLTGLPWRESSAIGILMNTRGLMELIVLNIGLDLGVISPTLFTMMVVMALATTFMTSPLLRWIYPGERARDLVATRADEGEPFRVLVSVSHAETAPGLAVLGSALARSSTEALLALHLVRPQDRASFHLRAGSEAQEALAPLLARSAALGVEARSLSFVSGEPAVDICRTAEAKGVGLVLLGRHKPLFGGTVLGGTVRAVMQEASCDVAVLVDRGLSEIRRVLVPFMGSGHDRAALVLARRLLESSGAEVTILHVVSPRASESSKRQRVLVDELFPEDTHHIRLSIIEHAHPEEAVLDEAKEGYDLVVVGVGVEWGLNDALLGRHRERIVRDAAPSVVVVHHALAAAPPVTESRSSSERPASVAEAL